MVYQGKGGSDVNAHIAGTTAENNYNNTKTSPTRLPAPGGMLVPYGKADGAKASDYPNNILIQTSKKNITAVRKI